jgi:hypothetical protein
LQNIDYKREWRDYITCITFCKNQRGPSVIIPRKDVNGSDFIVSYPIPYFHDGFGEDRIMIDYGFESRNMRPRSRSGLEKETKVIIKRVQ